MTRGARRDFPVRHGCSVTHVATLEQAAGLMELLQQGNGKLKAEDPCKPNRVGDGMDTPAATRLFEAITSGAAEIQDALVNAFPLHGKATLTLSTAIRASMVRGALKEDEEL